ncbi:MAG TPA: cell division protein FtsA [Bacteroidales bacterium]|nr:cell division protein FtsA [Bacteroidales bacterium]
MKQKNNFVAAIDIGTTKIVAIIGRINEHKKLEILGLSKADSKGVKRGVVLNIEETVNAIQETISEAEAKADVKVSEVYVGIAGQHIKSMRNRGYINRDSYDDEITREDIEALINDMYKLPIDMGEEIIHVLPQNFIVDNETGVKNPVGMFGKRLEANFHIVIGQVASARNIEKCVRRVGLNVQSLILEPLASSEAVLTEDEKEAGVALVDIGGGTTDVAVFYDGIIRHTAVIPFGGNVVTQDIKEGCSILQRQAELLKIQFGSALGDIAQDDKVVTIPGISGRDPKEISFKSLAYIIQSRMEEIIDAVTFEIENSDCMDKLGAGIVITGGGSLLRHLPQLIKFRTGLDVRLGLPNEHLSGEISEEVNQPMYATSVGLLLKGFQADVTAEKSAKASEEKVRKDEPETEEESIKQKIKNKPGIIESLKKTITDIFEENDAQM